MIKSHPEFHGILPAFNAVDDDFNLYTKRTRRVMNDDGESYERTPVTWEKKHR